MPWSSWLPFFSKPKEDDYETILSSLAMNIDKRKVKLADIRLREQRTKFAATIYTLAAWVLYVGLWYIQSLPKVGLGSSTTERVVKGIPVMLGPIFVLLTVRLIQLWYTRKEDAEEKALQALLKEQRTKVDEIKKKTNYYSTRELLQRYDETPSVGSQSPLRPGQPANPVTPQRKAPRHSTGSISSNSSPRTPQSPAPRPTIAPTPTKKQWYDKLADAVLGDEDDTARYALICEECFAHNGLVKESAWDDIQYVCPKCKHLNPSRRSRGLAASPAPAKLSRPLIPPTFGPASSRLAKGSTSNGATPPMKSPLREETSSPEEPMEVDQ